MTDDVYERDAAEAVAAAKAVLAGRPTAVEEAAALEMLARFHVDRGEADEAAIRLDRARRCLEGLPADTTRRVRMDLANTAGRRLAGLGDPAGAREHFEQGLVHARALGLVEREAGLLVNLGNTLARIGDLEGALQAYHDSLTLLEGREASRYRGLALHNLAILHEELGDVTEALRRCEEALRATGERRASVLDTHALLLSQLGRNAAAVKSATRAVALRREAGHPVGIAAALATLGAVLCDAEDLDGAEGCYHEALALLQGATFRHAEAAARSGLATIHLARSEFREALDVLAALSDDLQELGDRRWAARILRQRATALRGLDALEEALDVLEAAHRQEDARARAETSRRLQHLRVKHELEQARRRQTELQQQLQQAQKLEAVGRLAGGVAHDFNNLLTVIQSYAQLLTPAVAGEPEAAEFLGQIIAASERAAGLTAQLLAFSRRHPMRPRPVEVNALLAQLEAMLARILDDHIHLEVHRAPEPGWIHVDPHQLEQVLLNLVVNARDAMPEGGELTLAASVEGDQVALRIRDTGTGIAPEHQPHVFDPFFTTKPAGEGTGLGLATAQGIVHQSGGRLTFDSVPGSGTTFVVSLPTTAERPRAAAPAPAPTQPLARPARILVVEDDDGLRKLLERVLADAGHDVVVAPDGSVALERFVEHAFDLVVTDMVMPRLGGVNMARRMLEVQPTLRFLFTSGYPSTAGASLDALPPGSLFLAKPFGLPELRRVVAELLTGRSRSPSPAPGARR